MALITKVKLGSLLSKYKKKNLYLTLKSLSYNKKESEPIILYNLYYNIEKYYCLLLKLIPRVIIYILVSQVLYTSGLLKITHQMQMLQCLIKKAIETNPILIIVI